MENFISITADNMDEVFANYEQLNEERLKGGDSFVQMNKAEADIIYSLLAGYAENPDKAVLKKTMELAKTHPLAFEHVLYYGSGWTDAHKMYKDLYTSFGQQPFSENLYAISVVANTNWLGFTTMLEGKKEKITTLPKDKNEILVDLFDKAKKCREDNFSSTDLDCRHLLRYLCKRGDLRDFKPEKSEKYSITPEEIRKEILSFYADHVRERKGKVSGVAKAEIVAEDRMKSNSDLNKLYPELMSPGKVESYLLKQKRIHD